VKETLSVGTATAEPGCVGYGGLPVGELYDGSPIVVPVAVVNGLRDGPVVWIQNAVHGDEYVGLGAIHRLLDEIDLAAVSGALVLIPVLNVQAFRAGSRMAPQDGMDMNRVWPGHSMERAMHLWAHSELVVHRVFAEITAHASHVIDLHDAGWMGLMSPYVSYHTTSAVPAADLRALAASTGMDIVWESGEAFVTEKAPGSIGTRTGPTGLPTLTLEAGGEGRLHQEPVERVAQALLNALRHLRVLPGTPAHNPRQRFVVKGNWIRPLRGGILYTGVRPLQQVRRGDLIGTVRDLFGRVVEELHAPVDGIIIGARTYGVVATGQYFCNVGELAEERG
jgi:predicted deacylase